MTRNPCGRRLALLSAFADQAAAALVVDASARAVLDALRNLLATRM